MKPLNSLTKRDLLASRKFNRDEIRSYGEEYFAQERFGEAFEFYRKIDDRECIRKVKRVVVEIGDPEVLWRIQQSFGEEVGDADWVECGDNAMKLAKYRSAAYCYERAKRDDKLAEARNAISPAPAVQPAGSPQPG